jgi:Fur family transcriptional regulator, peroxide stress response regulator
MKGSEIREKLTEKGLKVTPQRIAILEAVVKLHNHPTADNIIDYIRKNHPNIATATVYKVLDALVENGLINKVKTEKDIMRYDAFLEKHHHLYSSESDRIEDYQDEELNELLGRHFGKKGIPGFKIEDIKLQIIGKFTDKSSTKKI